MQRCGQRIKVAACVRAFRFNLFERRIIRCVTVNTLSGGELKRLFGQALGETEVEQNDLPLVSHLQVLWLDVAVNDGRLLAVQVRKRAEQLVAPLNDLGGVERSAALFEHRHQIAAKRDGLKENGRRESSRRM